MFYNNIHKKKEFIYDYYNIRGQLYNTFLKRNENSFLDLKFNFYFYNDFFKSLKYYKKQIIFKNFINNNNDILLMFPSYMFKNQYFSNKSLFNDLLLKFKLKGFFLYKNFFKNAGYKSNNYFLKKHVFGYNFFIINKIFLNNKYLNKITTITDDKEYNSIGKIKIFCNKNYEEELNITINSFFNFNLYCINILEIYKIFILIHLNNIN